MDEAMPCVGLSILFYNRVAHATRRFIIFCERDIPVDNSLPPSGCGTLCPANQIEDTKTCVY